MSVAVAEVPEEKSTISGPTLYYISGQFQDIFRLQPAKLHISKSRIFFNKNGT